MERGDNTRRASHEIEREDYVSTGDIYIDDDPDIPLFNSIREMIDDLPPISNDCCIFRVPKRIRETNEKAYTPQVVSIGPLHHGEEHLQEMERHKPRYLQSFLNHTDRVNLESCIRVVKEWEERSRSYYEESSELDSDEFVKMILLDSSFIIEVMWRFLFNHTPGESMDYLDRQIRINDLCNDVILIENQLPFFVLEGLFNLAFPAISVSTQPEYSFLMLSIIYFAFFGIVRDIKQSFSSREVKHFVDLLRLCHLPSSLRSAPSNSVNYVPIRNARTLRDAGIKFKKGPSNCLLDIRHVMTRLEIPQLILSNWTEPLLRNLTVLEQFYYPYDSYFIDYIHFMDSLIDTAKDADILIQSGIFENYIGDSTTVAALFNNFPNEVSLWGPNYYFCGISEKLNQYCSDRSNKWKMTFKRDYFSTPWRSASTSAAVILIGLTIIQTICSILSSMQ
ncbi:UPF0481 protein At3g47200-like [Cornus florida]|uniref:UPF0481 protein At3g47200-like n=1 Tax=Cornus florida TaxID=4283 RepID=UPI00289E43B0|nr:UPF0481 protein At3g47200-like [Cornus florida]